jgi:hypothetical protein
MNTTPIIHRVEAELPPVGMKLVVMALPASALKDNIEAEAVNVSTVPCAGYVDGLEWKLTDGTLVPIRKSDMWTYHPSLTAVIKLENELSDAVREVQEFKAIATYLADCEAATACGVGDKKSGPKCEKRRHAEICRSAIAMIEAGYLVGCKNINQRYTSKEGIKHVLQRCHEAAQSCEGLKV